MSKTQDCPEMPECSLSGFGIRHSLVIHQRASTSNWRGPSKIQDTTRGITMKGLDKNRPSRTAASLFATFFVLIGGLLSCAFIVLSVSDNPKDAMLFCGGVFAVCGILAWCLRDRPDSPVEGSRPFGWLRRGIKVETVTYRFGRKRKNGDSPPDGNQPPTAEEIRGIKQETNTWVPSKAPKRRRRG